MPNVKKLQDFTNSSFTMGGTLYKFKRKSLMHGGHTPQKPSRNPSDALNLYYDKHVSTCFDKYR